MTMLTLLVLWEWILKSKELTTLPRVSQERCLKPSGFWPRAGNSHGLCSWWTGGFRPQLVSQPPHSSRTHTRTTQEAQRQEPLTYIWSGQGWMESQGGVRFGVDVCQWNKTASTTTPGSVTMVSWSLYLHLDKHKHNTLGLYWVMQEGIYNTSDGFVQDERRKNVSCLWIKKQKCETPWWMLQPERSYLVWKANQQVQVQTVATRSTPW